MQTSHFAVLNALRMSILFNAQNPLRLLVPLLAFVAMSTTARMASCMDLPFQKPNWFSERPFSPTMGSSRPHRSILSSTEVWFSLCLASELILLFSMPHAAENHVLGCGSSPTRPSPFPAGAGVKRLHPWAGRLQSSPHRNGCETCIVHQRSGLPSERPSEPSNHVLFLHSLVKVPNFEGPFREQGFYFSPHSDRPVERVLECRDVSPLFEDQKDFLFPYPSNRKYLKSWILGTDTCLHFLQDVCVGLARYGERGALRHLFLLYPFLVPSA